MLMYILHSSYLLQRDNNSIYTNQDSGWLEKRSGTAEVGWKWGGENGTMSSEVGGHNDSMSK